jgi:hypothetical protein
MVRSRNLCWIHHHPIREASNWDWDQGWISYSNLRPMLEICALRPSFLHKKYSNLASCICTLHSTYCIFSQIWVHSTLYAMCPTFMKSTPVNWKPLIVIFIAVVNPRNQFLPPLNCSSAYYPPIHYFLRCWQFLIILAFNQNYHKNHSNYNNQNKHNNNYNYLNNVHYKIYFHQNNYNINYNFDSNL